MNSENQSKKKEKKMTIDHKAEILLAKDSPDLKACLEVYFKIQMDIRYLQELLNRLDKKILLSCLEQNIGLKALSVNHRKLRQILDC